MISHTHSTLRSIYFAAALLLTQFCALTVPASAQSQKLDTEALEITTTRGKYIFDVEIADEAGERTIGLMNREQLDPRGGMLFVFDKKRVVTMWMKNTLISLDMVFVSVDGTVVTIAEHTTPHSLEIVSSIEPVSYVLELNSGMAALIGIKAGDKLKHPLFD